MVNGYVPASLEEALEKLAQGELTPYAGGTDLMIEAEEEASYLFINKLPELRQLVADEQYIRIGAACTYTEVLESELPPPVLKEAVAQIAAPAIRNLGTIGGNLCNGSPKADSALILMAADAKLRLVSSKGERILPVTEFYLGRKKTALQKGELLAEILFDRQGLDNYYYKKVGARDALAISRVSFAAVLRLEGETIISCAAAFGAVSDVIVRCRDIEAMFKGKTIQEAKALKKAYLEAYDKAIVPIRGRISAEYRKAVCMNLLRDFLEQKGI